MIHFATVHHRNGRWVEIQREYLDRHMTEPFVVWASMEGVPQRFHEKVDRVVPSVGRHAGKLNHMARVIAQDADAEDVLVFLDGDAFPIADPMPAVRAALDEAPLAAIRRDENLGDMQPHPAFCATTVGFWHDIGGDWSNGAPWTNSAGEEVSDVGGNLQWLLQRREHAWVPFLRSNRVDLHPIWFGIYAGIVYHHGAGFRRMVSRFDWADFGVRQRGAGLRSAVGKLRVERRARSIQALAKEIEDSMRTDPMFYERFL